MNRLFYFSGYPIVNDPLYNHAVFGPEKGKAGNIGKTDDQLIQDLISIHNAENWLGIEGEDSVGGGDIFGLALPGPVDNHIAASPSSSSGTADCGASDTKGDSSPISTGEPLLDEPAIISEDSCLKIGNSTGESNSKGPTADDIQAALVGSSKVESESNALAIGSISSAPGGKVTVGTQTGDDEDSSPATPTGSNVATSSSQTTSLESAAQSPSPACTNDNNNIAIGVNDESIRGFQKGMISFDQHCYECKVRYRDPKPKDLVMYLHAIRYGVRIIFLYSHIVWHSGWWEES